MPDEEPLPAGQVVCAHHATEPMDERWADANEKQWAPPEPRRQRANAHREDADEHAATELLLYLDNDARFSPDSPSGQGRAIRDNLLRKWRKGTYDHAQAPQGWSYVVESAAKQYAKDFDSAGNWHRIFSPATRAVVALALADQFLAAAQSGEYD